MKLSHRREDSPDITLTPLIDVVFLLLIFFMVSTTFSLHAQLEIELPKASTEEEREQPAHIDIAIDVKGRFYVNGLQLVNTQPATLRQAMRDAAGDQKAPLIVVSADANTPYQSVVTAMDAALQLGFNNLSIATSRAEATDP